MAKSRARSLLYVDRNGHAAAFGKSYTANISLNGIGQASCKPTSYFVVEGRNMNQNRSKAYEICCAIFSETSILKMKDRNKILMKGCSLIVLVNHAQNLI